MLGSWKQGKTSWHSGWGKNNKMLKEGEAGAAASLLQAEVSADLMQHDLQAGSELLRDQQKPRKLSFAT